MFPVVGLIGARQVGKTTLARGLVRGERQPVTLFDLEDPTDEAKLADPKLVLEPLRGLVVIDEVQRKEGLFRLLRVLVDRPDNAARFLVLGSAAPELLRQSSDRIRLQAHERAGDDALDALGAVRPEARPAVHRLPRSLPFPPASACRSDRACARVRAGVVTDIAV